MARRLRKEGYSEVAMRQVIGTVSPQITTRHPNVEEYLKSRISELWPNAGPDQSRDMVRTCTSVLP
ncbi:MAG: hypothetical protein ACYCWM_07000 [Acidiferrobacteraceae bacterium]